MRYWIKVESEGDNRLIQSFLFRGGFEWSNGSTTHHTLSTMYATQTIIRPTSYGKLLYTKQGNILSGIHKIVTIPKFIDVYQKLREKSNGDKSKFLEELQ